MKTKWTEPSEEVNKFFSENDVKQYETDYFPDNRKRWTITTRDGKETMFEQFFDIDFFKK